MTVCHHHELSLLPRLRGAVIALSLRTLVAVARAAADDGVACTRLLRID
jgi:hypothetical protein